MARYLIENTRTRKVQQLLGRTLASKSSGGKTSTWVSEEEWESPVVQRRIESGRLALVRRDPPFIVKGEAPVLKEGAFVIGFGNVEAITELDLSDTPKPALSADGGAPGPVEPVAPAVSAEPTDFALGTWTAEILKARSYRDNQKLAKDHDVKASGTEDEIIERLLELQEASHGA